MSVLKKIISCFMLVTAIAANAVPLSSPSGRLKMEFSVDGGVPFYELFVGNQVLVGRSRMGFELVGIKDLAGGFTHVKTDFLSNDYKWSPVWGEVDTIRNSYNEMKVYLEDLDNRQLNICFRLYDDGLGFRYEFPRQPALTHFCIKEEITEFNMVSDADAYWIPGDYDSNEFVYQVSKLSDLEETLVEARKSMDSKTIIDNFSVQTPVLLKTSTGYYVNIHEAALVDYPGMSLTLNPDKFTFKANLTPDPRGNKGRVQTDFNTPWRTIIVGNEAADIIESKLILNLNEPCSFDSVSWIKPMKYIGVWWEMFVPGRSSWNYCDESNIRIDSFDYSMAKPNGRHGANTENVKKYIDFASDNGFDGVLVEGWNIGWEDWFDNQKEHVFDFQTPYPDFDIEYLNSYAAEKGISLIMHHETSGSIMNYERYMDDAYSLMNRYGYRCVKSGYVGRILPVGEMHYGQTFINHCIYALQQAAEHKIMINAHEAPKPTGLHRTYPNYLACESARGTEYEAFAYNNPNHTTILPFTRLVGGPMDYTPGIMQLDFSYYDKNVSKTLSSTLAKQLGLYVVIYSPFQMAADLPENYERYSDAFQFIKDVPVDWSDTKVLEAEPGQFVTIARKDKNSENWFIGNTTSENSRKSIIKLDFLDNRCKYKATIYSDANDADYRTKPQAYTIKEKTVNNRSKLEIYCAPGGGYAVKIEKINK